MTRSVPIGAYLALSLALLTVPRPAPAQDVIPLALTLEQALDIAHRNNPNLQATRCIVGQKDGVGAKIGVCAAAELAG